MVNLDHKIFFNKGILRKTKCVAAKHSGRQIMQRSSHWMIGYNQSGLSKMAMGTIIMGWNM